MLEKINYATIEQCPVTTTMEIIGGKWKILILYLISNEINRFGRMSIMLRNISKQMLTAQLRELEEDGVIERKIYAEIPPRVEYSLTAKGQSLMPVITMMKDWGLQYLKEQQTAAVTDEV